MALYGQPGNNVREILLTFDDGPNPRTTPRLLDTLAENNIKAVFFVLGNLLEKPEGQNILERAIREGHTIGNHSFSHVNLKALDRSKIIEELQRTHKLICDCTGGCKVFRPPYGAVNSAVSEVLLELGYTQLLWSVDTLDWKLMKEAAWVDHAMEQIKSREDSIVLMHDIHATTVDNLPLLIQRVNRLSNTRFVPYT
ncbi:MAG: polysaccharide deacetylase family protein [Thermodesulfobacteriota bacterium]